MKTPRAIRLATWNSHSRNLKFRWEVITGFEADVLSIQEAGPNTKGFVESHDGWTCEWQEGRYPVEGVAVLAKKPFRIEGGVEFSRPCVLSTVIKGPHGLRFRFVGFWGMTPINKPLDDYPQQAKELIDMLPSDDLPTVIAGDFNASSRNEYHLANVAALSARGLVSAYHTYNMIAPTGVWNDPTSYHLWNVNNRHHMDYVFLPKEWSLHNVHVGGFDEYVAGGLSDHLPIIVTASPT